MNFNQHRMMIITSNEKIMEQMRTNNNPSSLETFIFECDRNNNGLSHDTDQSTYHRKAKHIPLQCVVCGSTAIGRNFGVISCESCKIFFRRNALKSLGMFYCRHNNTCEITQLTRRRCSSCRLAKCLVYGMKRDRLLRAEEKIACRHKIQQNTSSIVQSNHDQTAQWRPSIYTNHQYKSSGTNRTSTQCLPPHPSFSSNGIMLTSADLQRIEEIEIAFEQRIEIAVYDTSQLNSRVDVTTFSHHLNSYSIPAMRLLTFFKQIPEFNELHVDDKLILTKYNLLSVFILHSALLFAIDTKQIRESEHDVPWNLSLLRTIHGEEIYSEMRKIFSSLVHIRQYDCKIIQLVLIVLFLTKGISTDDGVRESILRNHMALSRAQNYYIELLWKYMVTMHGLQRAVRIFNVVVARFLAWQKLRDKLQDNIKHHLSKIDRNELLPLMKSLLHIS
ncbi:unnamed protein product [Rotaria socialis]|uniref:Uncharacterized protein n=4 Tax=Rotaria socialis TaxID=392032 RepID=A0A821BVN6_9BILA|nr:unnamed protein product [Rotaria socialis]CAF4593327.1 unnamed protein product [Rotaria socialis]CAF4593335.1 unnamed protein product [Rotaria socialis]CAF4855440.1 unnamed protein product [Rotaria socialis]